MATIAERFRSLSGGQNTRRIGYIVRDALSDNDALDALEAGAATTYDGMPREDIELDEIDYNNGHFFATVTYSRRKTEPATNAVEYAFDFALATQNVKQSLSTVNTYVASGSATDFKQAIAVDADGVAQGVDIRVPISSFEVRYYPANATVSSAYQQTVGSLVGKVNNALFYGYSAGEVLFVGASGSSRNNADWELVYRFEVNKNVTGLTIGDISGIAVDGWDVLWVYFKQSTTATNRYIQKPTQVNIERVYERADFSVLNV